GVPVRSTRVIAVVAAVLLTSIAVTVAGPIAFVGLGAPVLARLLGALVRSLNRHVLLLPASALIGAIVVLLADAAVRQVLGPHGATAVPTGIPTALLGALIVILLARRLPDSGAAKQPPQARTGLRTARRFLVVLAV